MLNTLNTRVIFFSLIALLVVEAQAANIYKYKDNQGKEIIGSQVPAEYVKNGYQVLNERGRVIQEVPRTLTDEERAAQSEAMAQQRQEEEVRRQQEEADKLLLRLYRSPEEVIRRRDSTVEELDAQLTALTALLADAQERVDDLQTRAENNLDADGNPPPLVASQLEDATGERDRLQRQIDRIDNEKTETVETAQKNIDRLKELLNLD